MPKQNRALAIVLRLLGALVVLAGAAAVLIPSITPSRGPQLFLWVGLVFCVSLGVVMWTLATLLQREVQAPPEVRNGLSRIEHQVLDLQVKLKELYLMSDRAVRTTPNAQPAAKDYSAQFQQLGSAMNELRELSLLPDAERRQRSHLDRQNRKLQLVSEMFALVGAKEWARAERLLITLQTDFPNDDDVAKGRSYLEHSRNLVEGETIGRTTREVDELIASANWDRAWERVRGLVEGFPASAAARALHNRLQREYDSHCDTTAQRMFEGIRHDIDQRNWRQALARAQQLTGQFPSHRVTEGLRPQLPTLRENAEIQERQELEVRIQELMRDGQFVQAIELAEDLIHRYPMSPQADSLETMLPRIRELAREGVGASDTLE